MTEPEGGNTGSETDREVGDQTTDRSGPVLDRFGIQTPRAGRWQSALAGAIVLLVGLAVFWQLFRDGGLGMPGEGAERSWPILGPAIAAFVLASILDLRVTLRAAVSVSVIALIGLSILTFLSAGWSIVLPVEATRMGLVTIGYALIAVSVAVAVTRLSALPLAILIALAAVVAGAVGLWGFANIISPLAVINQGDLTPGGPFRYRNTLALLSAASLLPLARWTLWRSKEPVLILLSAISGLGLGVSITVVATSGSDFGWLMALVVIAASVLFPKGVLGTSRQNALGMAAAVVLVAILGWFTFRKVLGEMPEDGMTRTLVMVGLVVLTPPFVWGLGWLASRIEDRVATRVVQGGVALAVVLGALALVVSPPGGSLTQARQAYYEATIETAKQEPVKGFGAGSYAQASSEAQAAVYWGQTRFAHSIPGEMWVELGIGGLLLSLLLYAGAFVLAWRTRMLSGAVLLTPLVLGFLLSGLIDWSWHMTALTALWAAGLGGLIGLRERAGIAQLSKNGPGGPSDAQ